MKFWSSFKFPRLDCLHKTRPSPPKRPTRAQRPFTSVHRARTARANEAEDDGDDEHEATTPLSTAFIVVVALHLVAVGGIYAFNSLKANQSAGAAPAQERSTAKTKTATPAPAKNSPAAAPASNLLPVGGTNVHKVRDGETLATVAATHHTTVSELAEFNGMKSTDSLRSIKMLNVPPSKPVSTAEKAKADFASRKTEEAKKSTPGKAPARPLPKTYTVAKNDTVSSIVRKLQVDYNDFVKLNDIQNPKTLQIGRTLKVPQPK